MTPQLLVRLALLGCLMWTPSSLESNVADGSTPQNGTALPTAVPLTATSSPSVSPSTASPTSPLVSLPFNDINVLILTDIHSWVGGHALHEIYDADYGDILSLYQHLQAHADAQGHDLWFVMNGDIVHGTILGTNPPEELIPILDQIPFDAVNLGEHELEFNETIELMKEPGGYADLWGPGMLSSNVIMQETGQPFGSRYTYLQGEHGTLLVFGFLYNVEQPSGLVNVEKVEDVLESDWFSEVLVQNDFYGILVLAHMGVDDDLVYSIHAKIRRLIGDNVPVHYVTGHTHHRGYVKLDNYSSSVEAGRFLDTVGFLSFSNVTEDFAHTFIDANITAFENVLGESDWKTKGGAELSGFINRVRDSLGANEILGCSPRTYRSDGHLNEPDSLLRLYAKEVIPTQLLLTYDNNENNNVLVQNINFFANYDLYQGNITMDDLVAAIPEDDVIYKVVTSLRGDKLSRMVDFLSKRQKFLNGTSATAIAITADDHGIHSGDIRYELFAPSREAEALRPLFGPMRVRHPMNLLLFDGKKTLRSLFADFIRTKWNSVPCDAAAMKNELEIEEQEEKREAEIESGVEPEEEQKFETGSLLYIIPISLSVAVLIVGVRWFLSVRLRTKARNLGIGNESVAMLESIDDGVKLT